MRVYNYQTAIAHYNSIVPMRGTTERRALERSDPRKKVRVQAHPSNPNPCEQNAQYPNTVIYSYYGHDVVTWSEHELRINFHGYATSQSTIEFISHFVPVCIAVRNGHAWLYGAGEAESNWKLMHIDGENVFDSNMQFTNPDTMRTHAVNRKGMNAARARHSEFIDYLRMTMKLRDAGFNVDELDSVSPKDRMLFVSARSTHNGNAMCELLQLTENRAATETESEATERFYLASVCLAAKFRPYYGMGSSANPTWKDMKQTFDDMLMRVYDGCLMEKPLESGVVRDAHAKVIAWRASNRLYTKQLTPTNT